MAGIPRFAVAAIESGRRRVSLGEAIALTDALNVHLDDMLAAGTFTLTEVVHLD